MEGVSESSGSEGGYDGGDTGRSASAGVEAVIIAGACLDEGRNSRGPQSLSSRDIEVKIYDIRIEDAKERRDAAIEKTALAAGGTLMAAAEKNVGGTVAGAAAVGVGSAVITQRQFELDVLRREQQMVKEGRDPHAHYTPPELRRENYERGGPYDCGPPVFLQDNGTPEVGGCICRIDD